MKSDAVARAREADAADLAAQVELLSAALLTTFAAGWDAGADFEARRLPFHTVEDAEAAFERAWAAFLKEKGGLDGSSDL